MYDLTRFNLADMTRCGAALRRMGDGATCMEVVAARIARHLYDEMVDRDTGLRSLRLFKTHPYGDLDIGIRQFVTNVLGHEPPVPETNCLTLLARLPGGRGGGRRPRDTGGDPEPHLRPLLHHQRGRRGDGARARRSPAHSHHPVRGPDRVHLAAGQDRLSRRAAVGVATPTRRGRPPACAPSALCCRRGRRAGCGPATTDGTPLPAAPARRRASCG